MRVKISKLRSSDLKKDMYDVVIRNGAKVKRGTLEINYQLEKVVINLKKPLLKSEKTKLLIEIFNRFCQNEEIRKVENPFSKVEYRQLYVGNFVFTQVADDMELNTVLECLFSVGEDRYKEYNKKERIICALAQTNKTISKYKEDYVIELPLLIYLSDEEIDTYEHIVQIYLKYCNLEEFHLIKVVHLYGTQFYLTFPEKIEAESMGL